VALIIEWCSLIDGVPIIPHLDKLLVEKIGIQVIGSTHNVLDLLNSRLLPHIFPIICNPSKTNGRIED
jgi:hypothetical protein